MNGIKHRIAKVWRRIINKEYPHEKFLRGFKFPSDIKTRYVNDITGISEANLAKFAEKYKEFLDIKKIKGFSYIPQWDQDRHILTYKKHTFLSITSELNSDPITREFGYMPVVKEIDEDFIPFVMYIGEQYDVYLELKRFHKASRKLLTKIDVTKDIKEKYMSGLE